ncbi:MAG TPA: hypothetical protein VFP50_17755 [Anaeromyxobacteraceae bacterium]|nr:hypothetical protein [Anaeromyxobacteraceae bacterium]
MTGTAAAALLLAALAAAEDAPAPPSPEAPALAFRGRLEWLTSAGGTALRGAPANPANAVLALPEVAAGSELRPDLRFDYGDRLAAVVRPRFRLGVERARIGGAWAPESSTAESEWIEAYASWRLDDRLAVAYGLQNFQWGPAELTSPSNRIFHATGFTRDPLYVVRGRHLVRVNASAGREWSAVLLAEVAPNGEQAFAAGEPFEPKAQLKVEYAAPAGDRYVGVTGGAARRTRAWVGEYAALPLWAGLSAYLDAVHTAGRRAWYPVDAGGGATFAQTGTDTPRLRTLALGGLRYAFEGGADLRAELLFDEAGWGRSDLERAARAAAADPALAAAWVAPGFELPGRQLVYVSLLLPDLPPRRQVTVHARWLRSLTDGSSAAFVTASWAATEATVLFASAAGTDGARDGALSRLVRGTAVLGAVVSW